MSRTIFTPPPLITIPVVADEARFAVRRVFCAGRNYADHVVEMGGQVSTTPPVFFTKPASALVSDGHDVPYPRATTNLHHEIELVLALGKPLQQASEDDASKAVYGLATGIDLTRRDLQAQAKAKSAPWAAAKAFDHSAPIGPITPLAGPLGPLAGAIRLSVNGSIRQEGDLAHMLMPPAKLLAALSELFDLKPGDLVFTGTPAGVGPLQRNDVVVGSAHGTEGVRFTVV